MSTLIANIIGTAAAVCSITSFAPQISKLRESRDASSISLKTYSLTVTCFVLWVIYGVMTAAWPVTFANSAALCMAAIVLGLKVHYGRKAQGSGAEARHDGDPGPDNR